MINLNKLVHFFIIILYSFYTNIASSNMGLELRAWEKNDDIDFSKWFSENKITLKNFIDNKCPYKNISKDCSDIIYQERIKYAEEKMISINSFNQSKQFGIFLRQYILTYINLYVSTKLTTNANTTSNLEFNVRPLFLYDYDKITRIFNLTPNNKNSHDNSLEFNHFENGFLVQKFKSIVLGIGANTGFYFSNITGIQSLLNFTIGLVPTKEKTSLFNYFVEKKEDIYTTKRKVPFKSENLESWSIGDNVLFKSSGGAVFVASAGIPFLKAGTTMAAFGTWMYYLEKTDKNKVYINATRVTTKAALAFTNTLTINATGSILKDVGVGHSFEVDLSDFKAAKAYEDMLKGNIVPMQEMASDDTNLSVINVETNEYNISGHVKSFIFDISIIKLISSKANYYSLSNSQYLKSGLRLDNEYGIYSREISGRLLSKHKNRIKSFYGGITKVTNQEDKLISYDNKIQFNWNFEKDHFEKKSFKHAINEIIQDTGLDYLNVNTPDIEKLGYVRINLKAEADSHFANAINGFNKEFIFSNIQKNMLSSIESYFNDGDKDNLCNITEIIFPCKTRYLQETIKAFNKIKALSKFLKNDDKNTKEFAKAYAKIGEQAWSNQFIFKAVLEQMQICGSKVVYEISGEKISDYKIETNTVRDVNLCK